MSRLTRSVVAVVVASSVMAVPAAAGWPAVSASASTAAPESMPPAVVASAAPSITLPGAAATPAWQWPVDPPRSVTRPYVAPATPYSAGHRGVDLRAADGGTVYAPADGTVHFSGHVVDRPVLSIRHPGEIVSSYEPVESPLSAGTPVRRGQPVGTVLAGHCAPGVCVHIGVRLDGEYVSPMLYLGDVPRSVLLPTRPLATGR